MKDEAEDASRNSSFCFILHPSSLESHPSSPNDRVVPLHKGPGTLFTNRRRGGGCGKVGNACGGAGAFSAFPSADQMNLLSLSSNRPIKNVRK